MWANCNKKSIISIWRSLKYKMVAALHSSVVPGSVPAFQLPYVSSLHRQMALCLHWRPRLLATGSLFLLKLRRRQCKCMSVKGWCHSVSGPGVYLTQHADWGCLRSVRGWVVSVWANNITYSWLPSSLVVDRWICTQELQRKTHTAYKYALDYNRFLCCKSSDDLPLFLNETERHTSCLAVPSAHWLNRERKLSHRK